MSAQGIEEDGFVYGPTVLDHFQNPRNAGQMADPDYVGEAGNPVCGDRMRIFLKVTDGKVSDAKFLTFGCSVAIAASSVLTELVLGRTLDQLKAFRNSEIVAALDGLPEEKVNCSILAEDALRSALTGEEEH